MQPDEPFVSALERFAAKREEVDKAQAITDENRERFRLALNAVMDTENGRFVFRVLINHLGVFLPDNRATPQQRYERSLLRDVYLTLVRPYLERELIIKLENNE